MVRDDGVVRTEIRNLFAKITNLCKETEDPFIRQTLTLLYFEILQTFHHVLEKGPVQTHETDFENFVFGWEGEFPNEEVVARFNEKSRMPKLPNAPAPISSEQTVTEPTAEETKTKDKVDLFLEEANKFSFSEMPKVKELGTKDKIRRLVECILCEKGSYADTFGHTAAMLDFLGFHKWIAQRHVSGFTLTQYDKWCTRVIMNKKDSDAFRHYRLSLSVPRGDTENASYKYKGWEYKDSVKDEYNRILKSR